MKRFALVLLFSLSLALPASTVAASSGSAPVPSVSCSGTCDGTGGLVECNASRYKMHVYVVQVSRWYTCLRTTYGYSWVEGYYP